MEILVQQNAYKCYVFINGSNDLSVVCNAFPDHFESVYCNSNDNSNAKQEFETLLASIPHTGSSPSTSSLFTVELVDNCICKLKLYQAAGPDELSAEHILNAHPLVIVYLCLLFRDIAMHGYVPDQFSKGVIVPLLKDKLGSLNDTNNYRGITLIPVISKLFEIVLLEICTPYICTDELQFGFKKGICCDNATFLLQQTVDYFVSKGSSVFMASLDIKKAFDRVNHFKLSPVLLRLVYPSGLC